MTRLDLSLEKSVCVYIHRATAAISVRQEQLGLDHPDTLTSMANLAAIYFPLEMDDFWSALNPAS